MKCPNCEETLIMTERRQVEIDYCPKCRGVWLDKGELDKIIERSAAAEQESYREQEKKTKQRRNEDHDEEDDNGFPGRRREHGGGSFLSNLFDF